MTTTYPEIHTVMTINLCRDTHSDDNNLSRDTHSDDNNLSRDTHSDDNYAALYRKPIKQVPFYNITILLLTTLPGSPGQY